MRLGKFITIEGIDGAGKSTHIETLMQALKESGHRCVATREPGGTELGEGWRKQLLTESMSQQTELLLMFAARAEHLHQVIRPALKRGDWVICDRFTDATYAYQGGGRHMPLAPIQMLESWLHHDCVPSRTYLFDLPVETAAARLKTARAGDRFEREQTDFFERVRQAYLTRAHDFPERFLIIQADQPIDDIKKLIERDVAALCIN